MPGQLAALAGEQHGQLAAPPGARRSATAPAGASPVRAKEASLSSSSRLVLRPRSPGAGGSGCGSCASENAMSPSRPAMLMPRCRCRFSACARSAASRDAGEHAAARRGSGGRRGRRSRRAAAASSMMTWALVPPMPNELTPARRGRSVTGHGRSSGTSAGRRRPSRLRAWARSTCSVRGQRLVLHGQHHLHHPGHARRPPGCGPCSTSTEPIHSGRRRRGLRRRRRPARPPRSGRPAWCPCRAPRRSRCRRGCSPAAGQRGADDRAAGPGRWARSGRRRAVVVHRGAAQHAPGSGRRRAGRRTAA